MAINDFGLKTTDNTARRYDDGRISIYQGKMRGGAATNKDL
jgi:hypothetical protein